MKLALMFLFGFVITACPGFFSHKGSVSMGTGEGGEVSCKEDLDACTATCLVTSIKDHPFERTYALEGEDKERCRSKSD